MICFVVYFKLLIMMRKMFCFQFLDNLDTEVYTWHENLNLLFGYLILVFRFCGRCCLLLVKQTLQRISVLLCQDSQNSVSVWCCQHPTQEIYPFTKDTDNYMKRSQMYVARFMEEARLKAAEKQTTLSLPVCVLVYTGTCHNLYKCIIY